MDPVNHSSHNFVYRGLAPGIGDLSCRVEREGSTQRAVYSHWRPTDAELQTLLAGGTVVLGIYTHQAIPSVSMGVEGPRLDDDE